MNLVDQIRAEWPMRDDIGHWDVCWIAHPACAIALLADIVADSDNATTVALLETEVRNLAEQLERTRLDLDRATRRLAIVDAAEDAALADKSPRAQQIALAARHKAGA